EDWPLVPTILRGNPSRAELDARLDRTFGFLEALVERDPELQAYAADADVNRFLELVAVAQHCGLPTDLLDFTTDIRSAAYFASTGAKPGGTGSILVLHLAQYERLEGPAGSPYGVRATRSAPNPRIARQHGLFIFGHD